MDWNHQVEEWNGEAFFMHSGKNPFFSRIESPADGWLGWMCVLLELFWACVRNFKIYSFWTDLNFFFSVENAKEFLWILHR